MDGLAVGVGEHPSGIVDADGVVLGGLEGPPAARTARVVGSRSMERRALSVLPRVSWSS